MIVGAPSDPVLSALQLHPFLAFWHGTHEVAFLAPLFALHSVTWRSLTQRSQALAGLAAGVEVGVEVAEAAEVGEEVVRSMC